VRAAALAILFLAFLCASTLADIGAQAQKGGNPEAAKLTNPVAKTPESIAAGKRTYQRMCARCHGPGGKGDGSGTTIPSDLTDEVWEFGSSDGEIFTAIHDGTSIDMDGYAGRISDTDMWNLVNFLRSIGLQK